MSSLNLVLIGMRCTGKTSVGRLAAAELGRPLVDTDDLVEARAGKTIARIFAEDGESAFRTLEAAVVRDVTARHGQVIATGGGVVLSSANVAALRTDGCVVHLVASPETIHARLAADDGRERPPLTVAGGDLNEVRKLWEQRESAYRQARHQMVSAEDMSVQAVAAAVLAEYRRFAQDALPGNST